MSKPAALSLVDGVFSGAIASGIKAQGKDLAFIFVPEATACAGAFTKNAFAAACVDYSRRCIATGAVRAIVINSGNANAATGEQGARNCLETAEVAAEHLGIEASEVAIASTGIIGRQLPMPIVRQGLATLLQNPLQQDAAGVTQAIMTTDLVPKEAFREILIDGRTVRIAGIAKGSGMIAPNMATMLGFLVSDADLPQAILEPLFQRAIQRSFNRISVDSDTSTNDMALLLLSGKSGVRIETEEAASSFEAELTEVCIDLAKQIARDGEGATKLIEVVVSGAKSEAEAAALAMSIINSPLVKTAVHGADPNWGRVAMALGKTPEVTLDPQRVSIAFQGTTVFLAGAPVEIDLAALRTALNSPDVEIAVELELGSEQARVWGCDLTKGYIDINVDYN